MNAVRNRFRAMHDDGMFVIPNAWDVGSARLLVGAGARAVATTSSGFAATLGRPDQAVTAEELLAHAAAMAAATEAPVSVDSERCFADDPADIGVFVDELAATGVAGFSIEDYDPLTGSIDTLDHATERVTAAVAAAGRHGLVLTARAENHLYGIDDLDDTIGRLRAYRSAGAEVLYAPGLRSAAPIERVVTEVDAAVNVLAWPGGPTVDELRRLGARRVSVGGGLAFVAYAAALDEFRALVAGGGPEARRLDDDERAALVRRQ